MGIFRDRPNPFVDNLLGGPPTRAGRYGEMWDIPLSSKEFGAADEGSYYIAVNPTPGTGIVGPVSTTWDEAKALMTVYNGGVNRIYPQLLQLYVTVIGTTGTRQDFTHALDTGNRYSSGGTALTKANVNMDSIYTSGAVVTFGALVTTAASSSRRLLGNHQLREAAIEVVGDFYEFNFAGPGGATQSGSRVATVADFQRTLPPVAIGPGQTYVLHYWRASITVGITFEANFQYIER